MENHYQGGKSKKSGVRARDYRLHFFGSIIILFFLVMGGRLFQLQILGHETYLAQAASEHQVYRTLPSERGKIYTEDRTSGQLFPLAINKDTYIVYVEPNSITEKIQTADQLAKILDLDKDELRAKIEKHDPYEQIKKGVEEKIAEQIIDLNFRGVGFLREPRRYYPDGATSAHIIGFLGQDEHGFSGRYGIEGFFNKELTGMSGSFKGEKDAMGKLIAPIRPEITPAQDGADIVLTIDRTIQFYVCDKLAEYVKKFDADQGTVIVTNPETGDILALCSVPSFDPNNYNTVKDQSAFTNPAIFEPYEPGSIFKPITLAAGIDSGKVEPGTTYEDTGVVKIGKYKIQNSDLKAHGNQTMTQVLEKSLNTGAIYVARLVGKELFKKYVTDFGFGARTGIELDREVSGNTASLDRNGEIYLATNSFGQGLSVTPMQIVNAFGAIANGGRLMKPHIVKEIRQSDGTVIQNNPEVIRQVISERASALLGGMLISVVENGHGKQAGVPGYFVAGKTGTAQIPHPGGGYYKDQTIGSFVGFAPATNPRFALFTKLVRPKGVQWAESTAAPLFGDIAKFLLNYYEVPPERK